MDETGSRSHTRWECKYHVVFIPKGWRKALHEELRRQLGEGVPQVSGDEGEPDRREALAARPRARDDCDPAQVCCAARDWVYQREEYDPPGTGIWGEKEEFCGTAFLGTRVLGITVGRDETVIWEYIRKQEAEDKRLDQINPWR